VPASSRELDWCAGNSDPRERENGSRDSGGVRGEGSGVTIWDIFFGRVAGESGRRRERRGSAPLVCLSGTDGMAGHFLLRLRASLRGPVRFGLTDRWGTGTAQDSTVRGIPVCVESGVLTERSSSACPRWIMKRRSIVVYTI
jgi:hypothetical protein